MQSQEYLIWGKKGYAVYIAQGGCYFGNFSYDTFYLDSSGGCNKAVFLIGRVC